MRALLTELLYDKVTWQTKSINIHLVVMDITPKKYLIDNLNSILVIQFLISYQLFILYLIYTPIRYYLRDNFKNPQLNNNDEQLYREMHIVVQ